MRIFFLTLAVLGCGAFGPPPALVIDMPLAPRGDTVDFVSLEQSATMRECAELAPGDDEPCRVRRQWTADALRERVGRDERVWREGDTLTFVYEGAAESVMLVGGLQVPLSPLRGTPLWVVTVRIPRIDEAFVSYAFLPRGGPAPPPPGLTFATWRGPAAAELPVRATRLRGRLVRDTLASRFLPGRRAVTAYLPPAAPAGVVYMGDGKAVADFASVVDTLVSTGQLPPLLLVGAHAAERLAGGEPLGDQRALEYLYDYGSAYGGDDARFQAHLRFFAEELVAWAEASLGAPSRREARAALGFSNSAALAVQLGLRRPDVFARVIAISTAGHVPEELPAGDAPFRASFRLSGGVLEPPLRQTAVEWHALLRRAGLDASLWEPVAGHDPHAWGAELPHALRWAFRSP